LAHTQNKGSKTKINTPFFIQENQKDEYGCRRRRRKKKKFQTGLA
jgi:hypothetical protein